MDSGTGTKTPHILLLEDDRAHQDLILRAFRNDPEPFRVTVAGNILDARQVIGRDPPDLIIADWILPDGKGLDILPRRDGRVTIPLVIMTRFGDEHLAVKIMKSGAIDYVVKSATLFRDLPHIARRALHDWENILERKRAEEAVQESQKRLADIIGFLPDAVLAIDNDGRVIAWNDAIERMTGVVAKDMIGKGDHEYSIPFYGERRPILIDLVLMEDGEVEKKYDDIQRDGRKITSETFIPTLYGGKGAYLWGTASPLLDSAGNHIGAIEVIRDITERRQADEKIRESEKKYRFLVDNVKDIVWQTTPDLTFTYLSPAAETLTGYPPEELIGTPLFGLLTEPSARDIRQRLRERMEEFFQGRPDLTPVFEAEMVRKDGSTCWFEISSNMVISPDKTLSGFQGISRDITERKLTEQALYKSERNLSRAQEIGHLGNWDWDIAGNRLVWSEEIYKIFGIPRDFSLSYERIASLIHIEDRERNDRIIQEFLSEGREVEYEFRIIRPDGMERSVYQKAELTRDSQGSPLTAFGIIQDITERKKTELALQESETRFKDLFNNMSAGVAIYDATPDGKDFIIRDVNRAVETIEHIRKEEIVGKNVLAVFPGVVEFGLFDVFQRVARTGIAESHPVSMYHDNRISGWRENYVYKLPSGEVVAIYEDVTEKKQAEEKLRESEEKYHRLYDSMRDSFASVNMNGRITLFNEPFQKMVGYEKDELYNLTYNDLTPHKWHTMEADIIKNQVLSKGYSEIYEKEYRRKDGTVFPVELRTFLVKDDCGNPQSMSAIIRDITERKRAEEALRDSEEKYRNLAENVHDGVYIYDGSAHFMFVNHRAADITGYSEEELLSMNILDIVHPDDHTYIRDIIAKRFGGSPAPDTYELHIVRKDGIMRVLEISVSRITYRGQFATLGAARDITDRKRAEEKLQESEIKYRELVDHLPIGIGTVTFDGHPLTLNDAMYRITGTSPETIQETNTLITYVNPEDRTRLFKRLDQERVIRDYEVNLKKPDGTQFYANLNLVRFISQEESIALVMMEDISEKKKTEEALRQTETRFRALIQNSSDIIRILNREGRIVYESDSAERILGYPPGHLIGSNPMDYIHPDDLELVKNDFRDVLDRTNTGTPTEFRIQKADGEYLWVDAIATNLLEIPGVNGIVVTTRPIQQRKEAEQALKKNEARLATAMDIAGLVNWEFDVATGMFTFDDRFYTLYATTAEREGGNLMSAEVYMQEFVYPEDRPMVLASIQKILATTNPDYFGQLEHRIIPRDGSVRTIISRFAPVMGPDGKVIRTYGANQDITDLKLMEDEIRSLNTTLEQRVRDRTEALSRVNEALEAEIAQRLTAEKKLQASFDEKVTLLKEVHHRVKNNLQIIASLLNLQSRYIKDESSLAVIRESQNRIKAMALVHEKLYRAEDLSHISLSNYIKFLGTGLFQFYDARSRGIQFILDIHEVNVDIDAAIPLGLIMNELISNSLKYAFTQGRKGEIAISVKKEGHTLTVVYRDTGIGIPAEMDWRNTPSLGLRLVNTLVDQLNGTVELDRSAGTEFTMVLHEKE